MNIYVAADFARADKATLIANGLRTAGHTVVSRWHGRVSAPEQATASRVGGPDRAAALAAARRNLADLDQADVLVVLTTGELARGGRHFETGYAYRAGIPVILVGPVEHAFHHLDGVNVSTHAGLFELLDRGSGLPTQGPA